jgi:acyl-CoA thioesterase-1
MFLAHRLSFAMPRRRVGRLLALLVICLSGAGKPPLAIVALGDSLTAGYGLLPGEDFASRLEAGLRRKGLAVQVANAGVSGDTAQAGLARLDWAVPDGTALVIVELGANDALRGIDPSLTKAKLAALIEHLKARRIPVLLAGMRAPPNMGETYVRSFDAIYPALAQAHAVPLYPFFLAGVAGNPKLNQLDGIHPTAAGVERIVEGMVPAVVSALGRSGS